jgi:hypothetical protein
MSDNARSHAGVSSANASALKAYAAFVAPPVVVVSLDAIEHIATDEDREHALEVEVDDTERHRSASVFCFV